MEYTQNYQLPLWDKEDSVIRTDFNENNQKIDAAIAATPKVAAGTYTGDGAETRVIELPFTPRIVYVCDVYGNVFNTYNTTNHYIGGMASTDLPCSYHGVDYVSIVEGGFQVVYQSTVDGALTYKFSNNTLNNTYRYVAIG